MNSITDLLDLEDANISISSIDIEGQTKTIYLETAPEAHFCPCCGFRMHSRGTKNRKINHPILQDNYKLVLILKQRRWRCTNPDCLYDISDSFKFVSKNRRTTNATDIYQAIKEEHEDHNYSVVALCKLGNISRAAYYKWLHREIPKSEQKNRFIADEIEKIHTDSPDKGYRRIRDDLERYHGIDVNDKRVLRICRKLNIKSTIKYSNNGCTRQAANPQYIAENILNREFTAKAPNEKWLTDVTEFHYYIGMEKHKVYLSAILDLYDRRIVSYVIRDKNNNALVFDTVDNALLRNPGAQPLFHSDRGFQYTNRTFHTKLVNAGIIQSMSRVAKCIDNGPMEGFWGILKRERYYGKRFTDRSTLVKMIEDYIDYYNNKRLQRNLGILTPMEKHEIYLQAA